ncbi:hypothetical protein Y5S_00132 [Alcanivorax nanhaiticus]|uniref:DUF748 domain-containing protein n=1 Tax=Alcanivorax nanhaiticus TaxID=1177154 RepID=A0A095UV84_9GAMM|nr:DUF748 domain-containing protein [Alcanivorax nanhaiticus]KGD66465.1 hypothetical protein Y5S_00132 [Alcanivorax nanhaiticus]
MQEGSGVKVLESWKQASWKLKTLVILGVLYLLYVLLGFLVAPGLVRDNAQQALEDLTGREVRIDEVKINPLALSATINGFAIHDEQTEVLAGFDHLYVNFQVSSLFRWAWYFDQVALDGLTVRARRNPDSVFNFDDVLTHIEAQVAAEPEAEASTDEEEGGLPNIAVGELALTNGDLRYTEAAGKKPHELVLPIAFTVNNFSTVAKGQDQNDYAIRLEGPDGGAFDWAGHFEFSPFLANGRLQVKRVDLVSLAQLGQEQVRFTVPSGELDFEAEYAFTHAPDTRLEIKEGLLALRNLAFQKPGEASPSIVLPNLELSGIGVDTLAQTLSIPEMEIAQPEINAVLEEAGVDLATLFLPPDPEEAEARKEQVKEKAQEAAERIKEAETLWKVTLDKIGITDSTIRFTDRTLSPAQTVALTKGDFTLTNLVVGEEAPFQWQGSATVADSGSLSHSGEGQLAPLSISSKASLAGLPLATFSPWLEHEMPLSLSSGLLGLEVSTQVSGDAPDINASGSATVQNMNVLENGRSLLKINQGALKGLSLSTANQQVQINEVSLTGLDALHQIDAQGRDASTRIAAGTRSSSTSANNDTDDNNAKPWQVAIKQVRLVGSQVRHEDLTVSPNFRIGLYQLSGVISNLNTRPGSKANLNLQAQIDRYAPFSVKGVIAPEPLYSDLTLSLKNYEMTSLTPFTGLYLGYQVEKGQLGVETGVDIENNHLQSKSDIRADQFYLGEKVESEEAVKVPIKLGLSVLRSRSGEIHLPVTMSGDLDDPSFSVTGMILKVLTNIVVKAATAPFSVLAGLTGGQSLEQIPFAPGSAEVNVDTSGSLEALAKVLDEKQELSIGLIGTTNGDDRVALAQKAIGTDIDGDGWNGIDLALEESSLRRKLKRRYESTTDSKVESLVGSPLPEDKDEADKLLAQAAWDAMVTSEAASITGQQLVELARMRSENAKAALVQQFGVAQSRVYLNESKVDGEVSGLTLTLGK